MTDAEMSFIAPMLCTILREPARLDDPRYAAEPKFDGQRAQIHVAGGRTVAAYSRPGRDLLRHRGLAWLRQVHWPVRSACLDGELYSGEGSEGIDAILMARGQPGSPVAFGAFDVLQVGGREVMGEPWVDRRKRLEDLFAAGPLDGRVQLVPTTDDARRLWAVWVVDWGGEGIVLKGRRSVYRPGTRSRAWWKAKHKLTLTVEVLHCAPELVRWGDWGMACVMAFSYRHPRTGEEVTVEQAIRVPYADAWTPRQGSADVVCWGVLRSGLLRHAVLVGRR
jgi:bifunctional non-homologous end joining protein LigD